MCCLCAFIVVQFFAPLSVLLKQTKKKNNVFLSHLLNVNL